MLPGNTFGCMAFAFVFIRPIVFKRTSYLVDHVSSLNVDTIKHVCYTPICPSALFKLSTGLIMAAREPPQSQLSLGSCGVERERSCGFQHLVEQSLFLQR